MWYGYAVALIKAQGKTWEQKYRDSETDLARITDTVIVASSDL